MSSKFIENKLGYQPVTVEITFDSLQQLCTFSELYSDPYKTAEFIANELDGQGSRDEIHEAVSLTVSDGTKRVLLNLINKYSYLINTVD